MYQGALGLSSNLPFPPGQVGARPDVEETLLGCAGR